MRCLASCLVLTVLLLIVGLAVAAVVLRSWWIGLVSLVGAVAVAVIVAWAVPKDELW